jgi:transcriptional regulator with PAS, ATPase and Fis domain
MGMTDRTTMAACAPVRASRASAIIGNSAVMQDLRTRVWRVGRTRFTVLIEGESGAGKELVAREIHACSERRAGPFVAVNCAAIVESLLEAELFGIEEHTATGVRGRPGKFERADRGTLFMDEIGDLSPAAQAKLLRVLQESTVERVGAASGRLIDTRIVAATNRSLYEMVGEGRFRRDLYYRLAGVEIVVPPLRLRRDDIPLLIEHFFAQHPAAAGLTLGPAVRDALVTYDWPGNVRELSRTIERAVALATGPVVTLDDLPDRLRRDYVEIAGATAGNETLRAWSGRYVRLVLERCRGNRTRACEVLDISYHTLRAYLDEAAASRLPDPSARPTFVAAGGEPR